MKTKTSVRARKNKTAKKRGSGPGMSRPRQAWHEAAASAITPIERIKKYAIDKVMKEVMKYYDYIIEENKTRMNSRTTTRIPSIFRSRPRTEREMTIAKLAEDLKKIDINRKKYFNLTDEEATEFYSKVAFAYFNSNNYKDYLEKVRPLRMQFYEKLRTIYLPEVIKVTSVTDVEHIGPITKREYISPRNREFLIEGNEYLGESRHIYKIEYRVNDGDFGKIFFANDVDYAPIPSGYTDILVDTYLLKGDGQPLFNKDKFPTVGINGMESLLYTMSAHPDAAQALDASTVDLIAEYTK